MTKRGVDARAAVKGSATGDHCPFRVPLADVFTIRRLRCAQATTLCQWVGVLTCVEHFHGSLRNFVARVLKV